VLEGVVEKSVEESKSHTSEFRRGDVFGIYSLITTQNRKLSFG